MFSLAPLPFAVFPFAPLKVAVFSLELKTAVWQVLGFVFDDEHTLKEKKKSHRPPKTGRIWVHLPCFLSKVQKKVQHNDFSLDETRKG